MGKMRGFLLRHRIQTVFTCLRRRRRSPMSYRLLDSPSPVKAISRLFRWTRNLKSKVKAICWDSQKWGSCRVTGRGYMQVGEDTVVKKEERLSVPKGYMAVYVGQEAERVLVPVVYFNHPLFGRLLHEVEEEFGFNHPGAITIPCRISEFEHVQTRIKDLQMDMI